MSVFEEIHKALEGDVARAMATWTPPFGVCIDEQVFRTYKKKAPLTRLIQEAVLDAFDHVVRYPMEVSYELKADHFQYTPVYSKITNNFPWKLSASESAKLFAGYVSSYVSVMNAPYDEDPTKQAITQQVVRTLDDATLISMLKSVNQYSAGNFSNRAALENGVIGTFGATIEASAKNVHRLFTTSLLSRGMLPSTVYTTIEKDLFKLANFTDAISKLGDFIKPEYVINSRNSFSDFMDQVHKAISYRSVSEDTMAVYNQDWIKAAATVSYTVKSSCNVFKSKVQAFDFDAVMKAITNETYVERTTPAVLKDVPDGVDTTIPWYVKEKPAGFVDQLEVIDTADFFWTSYYVLVELMLKITNPNSTLVFVDPKVSGFHPAASAVSKLNRFYLQNVPDWGGAKDALDRKDTLVKLLSQLGRILLVSNSIASSPITAPDSTYKPKSDILVALVSNIDKIQSTGLSGEDEAAYRDGIAELLDRLFVAVDVHGIMWGWLYSLIRDKGTFFKGLNITDRDEALRHMDLLIEQLALWNEDRGKVEDIKLIYDWKSYIYTDVGSDISDILSGALKAISVGKVDREGRTENSVSDSDSMYSLTNQTTFFIGRGEKGGAPMLDMNYFVVDAWLTDYKSKVNPSFKVGKPTRLEWTITSGLTSSSILSASIATIAGCVPSKYFIDEAYVAIRRNQVPGLTEKSVAMVTDLELLLGLPIDWIKHLAIHLNPLLVAFIAELESGVRGAMLMVPPIVGTYLSSLDMGGHLLVDEDSLTDQTAMYGWLTSPYLVVKSEHIFRNTVLELRRQAIDLATKTKQEGMDSIPPANPMGTV